MEGKESKSDLKIVKMGGKGEREDKKEVVDIYTININR